MTSMFASIIPPNIMKMIAEHGDALSKIPPMLEDWHKTMRLLRDYAIRADEKLDRLDAKIQLVIDAQQSITPDIHAEIVTMNAGDMREFNPVTYKVEEYNSMLNNAMKGKT